MKRSISFALVLWLSLSITRSFSRTYREASYLRGYYKPQYKFATSEWLANYKETLISDLWVIPGTHNSGAIAPYSSWKWPVFLMAQDQSESLTRQMKFGIRSLDLRVAPLISSNNKISLYIAHTFITNLAFQAALDEIKAFVTAHPSEFILLTVRIDYPYLSHPGLWDAISAEINSVLTGTLHSPKTEDDTLEGVHVRTIAGKVLLITDSPVLSNYQIVNWKKGRILAVNDLFRDGPSTALQRLAEFLEISSPSGFFFRLANWIDSAIHYIFHFKGFQYQSNPAHADLGQLGGMYVDVYGVYGLPPVFTSWIYTDYFTTWLKQSPRRPGLVAIDFATPDLCESLFSQIRSL